MTESTNNALLKMQNPGLPNENELEKLKSLIDIQLSLEADKAALEEELANVKRNLKTVSQTDIPDLLAQYGLSEIKLDNGKKVIVKSDVSVTVKDWDKFIDFLKERHDDSIVKSSTIIENPTDHQLEFLDKNNFNFTTSSKVHTQTLKAYFREFMSLGEEPPDSVSVYVFSKAKIK